MNDPKKRVIFDIRLGNLLFTQEILLSEKKGQKDCPSDCNEFNSFLFV